MGCVDKDEMNPFSVADSGEDKSELVPEQQQGRPVISCWTPH